MKGNHRLHDLTYQRNLYGGEPTAILATEAARLDHNRRLIAGNLRHDPGRWAGGRNNLDVLDALFSDAIAAMLHHPPIGGAAW